MLNKVTQCIFAIVVQDIEHYKYIYIYIYINMSNPHPANWLRTENSYQDIARSLFRYLRSK